MSIVAGRIFFERITPMVASINDALAWSSPHTDSPSAERDVDTSAIHQIFDELLAAWGRGDGSAYGALFTDDADYIAFDGSHTKGRQEIAASHQRLFDSWLKGTRLVGEITNLRFLARDVALIHATGATLMPGKTRAGRPSIQTFVAVRQANAWRFAAFHNTRIVKRNPLQWMFYGITSKVFGG
jgi:uncharacterized protein (TIGR02246 family)